MPPVVAIVGRPNVGKSTLFNRISRQRRALIDDQPGVTRDRIYNQASWRDRSFLLVDTGGFEPFTKEPLLAQIREQTELAVEEADVILFLMDARDGLTPSDQETAGLLRRTSKPIFYVVNKVDGARHDELIPQFFRLGADRVFGISAKSGRGVAELLDELAEKLPVAPAAPRGEASIRVAVVGRPNVGKSSLVNRLCGRERSLVSPVPGTTRDAVDTEIRYHGRSYILIDTAGIRRKARTRLALDKYCVIKALGSLARCDVALLLIDASEGVTDQDARIGRYILERGRGCVVVANKWDLVDADHRSHDRFVERLAREMPHLEFAPVLTLSALTGKRVSRLLDWVDRVDRACADRVPTPRFNRRLQQWIREHPPPVRKGRRIKIHYAAQPGVRPPLFVFFCNDPEGVPQSYSRYLARRIREDFGFQGAPIRIHFRSGHTPARSR